jgi:uncharacterized OB-fold protein
MSTNHKTAKPFQPGLFDPGGPNVMPHLLGHRCGGCGEIFFPRKTGGVCTRCQCEALEEIELSRRGKISAFTVIEQAPAGGFYKGRLPYAYGTVDLPEGVRVITQFAEPFNDLAIGKAAEMVVEELFCDAEGNAALTYRFRPAEDREEN